MCGMLCSQKDKDGMTNIFIGVVILIVLYWMFLLSTNGWVEHKAVLSDPMNYIAFNFPFLEQCCSWWPISHFILFFIIGLLFPGCDYFAILAGIGWELVEVGMYHALNKDRQGVRNLNSNFVEYSESWWAGSFKDIFMNIIGFYTGKIIRKKLIDK